ncbi:MAG: 4-amino-4-deoxychorismate lyase [Clostridium sp.]|nr:4-amino-4-deoxychorismate lyase [Clostridium sp.]
MRKIIYGEDKILLDQGTFFGKGVFETILYLNKPVFLEEHLKRLKEGMKVLELDELEERELREFIGKLNINNKALKILVTPLNIIITEREIPYTREDFNKGMNLTLSKVLRNSTSRLTSIKSTCYIENILEKQKAKSEGFDDVLFINEKGYLAETSCSNIFLVKNNRILTPKSDNGLLRGIIRKWIMKNFAVEESNLTYDDLSSADEVFITNSLMGVMKVNKIDNFTYRREEITLEIFNKYNEVISRLGDQV